MLVPNSPRMSLSNTSHTLNPTLGKKKYVIGGSEKRWLFPGGIYGICEINSTKSVLQPKNKAEITTICT